MSEFKVKTQGLRNAADEEETLQNELRNIYNEVIGHRNSISFKVSATGNIRQRLSNISNGISREQRTLGKMQDTLSKAAALYEKTESKICDVAKDGKVSFWDKRETEIEGGLKPSAEIDLKDKISESNISDDKPWKKAADKIKEFEDDHKKEWDHKKGYYDQNGNYHDVINEAENSQENKKYSDISSLEKLGTIASIGGNTSAAVWSLGDEGSVGLASGSYNVSALKAEAEYSAYAGLYSYNANGQKHFTPGIGAEIGVGVTAFSATAKGQIGSEYFNAHGDVSVEAGKVGANAEVNVGLFDKDGKFNPQLGAGVSAEAILAEASASAGLTLAGTKIDAKGSVNFGVGAHANIGLVDGHLSVDIGASLGIGVGVKLDIDMSGTIDAIADSVSSAWDHFTGWFK